jgi:hypothetical protein
VAQIKRKNGQLQKEKDAMADSLSKANSLTLHHTLEQTVAESDKQIERMKSIIAHVQAEKNTAINANREQEGNVRLLQTHIGDQARKLEHAELTIAELETDQGRLQQELYVCKQEQQLRDEKAGSADHEEQLHTLLCYAQQLEQQLSGANRGQGVLEMLHHLRDHHRVVKMRAFNIMRAGCRQGEPSKTGSAKRDRLTIDSLNAILSNKDEQPHAILPYNDRGASGDVANGHRLTEHRSSVGAWGW